VVSSHQHNTKLLDFIKGKNDNFFRILKLASKTSESLFHNFIFYTCYKISGGKGTFKFVMKKL
jgi:hypothetical protein